MKWSTGLGLLALGGLAVWGTSGARRWTPRRLRGEVVLVTGGSRGLGLCIARELARNGCRLALLARDGEELARAQADLLRTHAGIDVMTVRCDVSDPIAVGRCLAAVNAHFGRIDGVVNVAGIIQVGPLERMTLADFEQSMAINFYGALHTIRAVVPAMRARRHGWIVNIDSIGGRVAPPHLMPYNCAKFALRGLSESLDAELAKDGIEVLTVLPGLMRTGSPVHAFFKGKTAGEFFWFATADMVPGLSIAAPRAARMVVDAVRLGKREVTLGAAAQLGGLIHDLWPGGTLAVMELVERLLPAPTGGSFVAVPGQALDRTAAGPLVGAIERFGTAYNEQPT